MEAITYSKDLKISPKKLRFLLAEIKKLKPVDVLDYLIYTPKRSSEIFYQVIKSALNNAKNVLKVDERMLRFKHLSVEDGHKLKRFKPGGRGMVKPILRRFSHIKIILEAEEPKIEKIPSSLPRRLAGKSQVINKAKITISKPKTKANLVKTKK